MKKYSFVIPTYNYKDYLLNCLESLNRQVGFESGDYEVVIADDGSNDGTHDIVKEMNFVFDLKYIYIERTKESCRNAARNKGWKNAGGEIIIFLDADMIVKDDFLQNLDMCYQMDNNITVVGLRFMLSEPVSNEQIRNGSIYNICCTKNPDIKFYEERHYSFNELSYNAASFNNPWIYFYSCNISVPKKYLQLVGGFNEQLLGWGFDDQELGFRLFNAGVKVIINQRLEGLHQFHGEIYGSPSNPQKTMQWYENVDMTYKINKDIHKYIGKIKLLFCYAVKRRTLMNRINLSTAQKHVLYIMDSNRMDEYKASIKSLSESKRNEIIVYDYVETGDLHIWVQLLGKTSSPVKYYPASRVLDKVDIKKHNKVLKNTFPQNRILFLLKMFFRAYIKGHAHLNTLLFCL